jgi:Protein phosphatase 2C
MTSGEAASVRVAGPDRAPSIVQGVVRGARHVREGKPCQDAVHGTRTEELSVLAIADGHGSSARGDVGARLAVEVAVERLLDFADNLADTPTHALRAVHDYAEAPLRSQMVREWTERVRQHANDREADLLPYGTTLLFALASANYVLVGQLGDGDMLLVDASQQVTRLFTTDPRHFAEETTSLCQADAWLSLRIRVIPPPEPSALLLMSTDGYSKSYENDEIFEKIGPDYLTMFGESDGAEIERQLPEILDAVSAGGSGDDIALGGMYWSAALTRATPIDPSAEAR